MFLMTGISFVMSIFITSAARDNVTPRGQKVKEM